MTKPKTLPPEAERQLEWLRTLEPPLPAWSVVEDHLVLFRAALPPAIEYDAPTDKIKVNYRRRLAAIERCRKTVLELIGRLLRKHQKEHVSALLKLEWAWLKCREKNEPTTQVNLAQKIAPATDPLDADRNIRTILKNCGWSWPEFLRFMESEPQGPKLENWFNEPPPEGWEPGSSTAPEAEESTQVN